MQKRVWSKYAIMSHDMRETFFNAEIFVREESGTSKHFEDRIFFSQPLPRPLTVYTCRVSGSILLLVVKNERSDLEKLIWAVQYHSC